MPSDSHHTLSFLKGLYEYNMFRAGLSDFQIAYKFIGKHYGDI